MKNMVGKNTVGKNTIIRNHFTHKRRGKMYRHNTTKRHGINVYGGDGTTGATDINAMKNDKAVNDIMKKIQQDHALKNVMPETGLTGVMPEIGLSEAIPESGLGDLNITGAVTNVAEAAAASTVKGVSDFLNVDLTNSKETEQKLTNFTNTLSDPKNQDLIKESIMESAKVGVVALQAADPFIKPLISDVVDKTKQAGSELGEAGVQVMLNTVQSIPGVGVVVGAARSFDTVGQAVLSAVNAGSEIVTSTSDAVNGSVQNFERLKEEKEDLLNRTSSSVADFTNGSVKKMGDMANKSAASAAASMNSAVSKGADMANKSAASMNSAVSKGADMANKSASSAAASMNSAISKGADMANKAATNAANKVAASTNVGGGGNTRKYRLNKGYKGYKGFKSYKRNKGYKNK